MQDNLEQLKDIWNRTKVDNDRLRQANRQLSEKLAKEKAGSLQDAYARRVRNYSIFALMLPFISPMLCTMLNMPVWVAVVYSLFGVFCSAVNLWLYRYVKACPLVSLPVLQAVTRATKIRYYQIRTRIACIIIGLPIIVILLAMLYNSGDAILIISAFVGLAIGLAIGISKLLTDLSYTRRILAALSEFTD